MSPPLKKRLGSLCECVKKYACCTFLCENKCCCVENKADNEERGAEQAMELDGDAPAPVNANGVVSGTGADPNGAKKTAAANATDSHV